MQKTSDKGLLFKIYKEPLKLNIKKIQQPNSKNGWKTLTDTSSKKKYRWQKSIKKDAPDHMSSRKCKLKHQ